jgi:4-amino-4-deoxy-L-arabinose transferase-like glycosyltransferase
MGGGRRTLAPWCALIVACTPAYLFTVMQNHVDQPRLFCVLASFLLLDLAARSDGRTTILAAVGLAAGMGLFVHSIGLLACILVALAAIWSLRRHLLQRVLAAGFILLVGITPVLDQMLENFRRFGSPIADIEVVPLYALPHLQWHAFLIESRAIASFADRWWSGALGGLTEPSIFGVAIWLFVAAAGVQAWKVQRARSAANAAGTRGFRPLMKLVGGFNAALLTGVVLFQGMLVFSLMLGMDTFIKNYRYPMTTLPLAVLYAFRVLGPGISGFWSRLMEPRR